MGGAKEICAIYNITITPNNLMGSDTEQINLVTVFKITCNKKIDGKIHIFFTVKKHIAN